MAKKIKNNPNWEQIKPAYVKAVKMVVLKSC